MSYIALYLHFNECLRNKYYILSVVLSHIKDPNISWLHRLHVHGSVTPISIKYNRRNLNSRWGYEKFPHNITAVRIRNCVQGLTNIHVYSTPDKGPWLGTDSP